MTLQHLQVFLTRTFKLEIESQDENKIIFNYYDHKIELNFADINQKLSQLDTSYNKEDTELFNDQYYEILIIDSTKLYFRERFQTITDQVNGLTYYHGKPSDIYLLYVLEKVVISQDARQARGYFDIMRYRRTRAMKRTEEQAELFNIPLLEFLKESVRGFKTITVTSGKNLSKVQFEQYSFAYIFTLSYNLSYTIYPVKFFDEFFSPLRVETIRRNSTESIEPPKRTYINDLILHYQKALSSESFDNQFLSFYHIIEHFFEKIYNEDLQLKIRTELTKPGFSYKKKTDIESLIKIVQSRTKIQREEFQVNELEALELTLKKYLIDIDELKIELNEIQANLVEYYKTTEVPFSKGNQVNFDLTTDDVFKTLAKRIYYTRNAIVHSKETDKKKYIPFKDDKDLLPEIYLMRLITEKILINNSREI